MKQSLLMDEGRSSSMRTQPAPVISTRSKTGESLSSERSSEGEDTLFPDELGRGRTLT